MDETTMQIIKNIKRIAKYHGWSLEDIADMTGYEAGSTISKKLSGHSSIDSEFLHNFSKAADISVADLIAGKGELFTEMELKAMTKEELYTYKTLGLDPKTCAFPYDILMIVDGEQLTHIVDFILLFYKENLPDVGKQQLYIFRPLDRPACIVAASEFWDGTPDQVYFRNVRKSADESKVVTEIVKQFSCIIDPLLVTGIFVEKAPNEWAFIHDGAESIDLEGTLVLPS